MDRISHRLRDALHAAGERLTRDLHDYGKGLLAAAIFCAVMQLAFGVICPFRFLLGLPCPGCGLTRACVMLFEGDLVGSFSMHPTALFALLGIISFPIIRYFFPKALRFWTICGIIWVVSTFIVFGYRMLTQFPGPEPICWYEGILQQYIKALLDA